MSKAMDTDGVISEGRVWEEKGSVQSKNLEEFSNLSLIRGRKSQANNVCVKTINILLSTYNGSTL